MELELVAAAVEAGSDAQTGEQTTTKLTARGPYSSVQY
jgi:hypothetical protein